MTPRTKWIIGVGSLIVLLIILTPIYYYIHDFYQLPRSRNPADWGTFGDFFGGVLNPIISLLTLIVTIIVAVNLSKIETRNHNETVHNTVKPLFTIGSEYFFSSDISRIGLTVERDFYDYESPQNPADPYEYLGKQFYLKVFNKGLGVAADVSVTFELDLNKLKSLLVIDDTRIKASVRDLKNREGSGIVIDIQSGKYNYQGFFSVPAEEKYSLGVVDKEDEVKAYVPSPIMAAFQFYNLIRRLKGQDTNFPEILVTFTYKNIHDRTYRTKFLLGLLHIHDYAYHSMFKIVPKQI